MNEKKIWDFLLAAGLNEFGVAGLMGNIYAESGLNPQNLQNTYEKKLGLSDAEYTAAVDSGKYSNFVRDSAGYGLCQWTYWSRKENLLAYAKNAKKSIGDLDMQLGFLLKELTEGYPSVLRVLKHCGSVQEASDAVLLKFERPADQSASAKARRAKYGQSYYDKYARSQSGNGGNSMSNSPLVSYTKISPNRTSPRNRAVDIITPHCVVGQCSVETLGNVFEPTSRQASCQYGIGVDGRVGMYCEEKDRSWCTSSASNDNRAITIECASDTFDPYAMNDKVYATLINLCVDICQRYGKTKLLWFGDKAKTLAYTPKDDEMLITVHRWFANKSCPGDWLYSRLGELAAEVTTRLGTPTVTPTPPSPSPTTPDTPDLKVGAEVNFTGSKHYTSAAAKNGKTCKPGKAKITAIAEGKAHPYHLKAVAGGGSNVYGWVDAADVKSTGAVNYRVRVTAKDLNIRSGPGTNHASKGFIDPGVYTIVEEADGAGASKWGKLKSGVGWISLDYAKKV